MVGDSPVQAAGTEADPVGRDEYLLRRVHYGYYEDRPMHPFQRGAFHPTSRDSKGISVFRERFCTVRALVEGARKAATEYYVVRLRAGDVLNAGFTLLPDPQPPPEPPGHTVIPELRFGMPRAERSPREATLMELANDRHRSRIVWSRQAL